MLKPEQKAMVSSQLLSVKWADTHLAKCLLVLQGKDIMVSNRRSQQCFLTFIHYVSMAEWRHLEKHANDIHIVLQILTRVLVDRLGCVNPQERTKKLLASLSLFITSHAKGGSYNSCDHDEKAKTLKLAKNTFKAHVKNMSRIGFKVAPADYLLELPENPEALKATHPSLYGRFKVPGCFMKCPLNVLELNWLDSSYACRGNSCSSGGNPAMLQLMDMQSNLLRSLQNGDSQDGGCEIKYSSKEKSSRLALPPSGAPTLNRTRTFLESDLGGTQGEASHATQESVFEFADAPSASEAQSSIVALEAAPSPIAPVAMPGQSELSTAMFPQHPAQSSIDASRKRGDELLDAMINKTKEAESFRRIEKKKKAACEAPQTKPKKQKKAPVPPSGGSEIAVDGSSTVPVPPSGGSEIAVDGAPVLPVAPETTEAASVATAEYANIPKPIVSHEKTRSQFLCRTGLKGKGQSLTFKYGEGKQYATENLARDAATTWLSDRRMSNAGA
jgi:hypothetical protein